jgi:hypothetical protein
MHCSITFGEQRELVELCLGTPITMNNTQINFFLKGDIKFGNRGFFFFLNSTHTL